MSKASTPPVFLKLMLKPFNLPTKLWLSEGSQNSSVNIDDLTIDEV
jgi:hypothetical protein